MHRIPITSSDIVSIGYDQQTSIMEVEFTSGDIFRYFDVSEYAHRQFINATSHGQFFHDNIKYNYRYQKVS